MPPRKIASTTGPTRANVAADIARAAKKAAAKTGIENHAANKDKGPDNKGAGRPPPAEATTPMYRVIQRVHDEFQQYETTAGMYSSFARAKATAQRYLLDEWGPQCFESITETEDGSICGGFEVYGQCPDGEEMWMYIEEESPGARAASYRVVRRTHDRHNRVESYTEDTRGWYETYEEAKTAVKNDLKSEWDDDFWDVYEELEEGKGQISDRFEVYALCPEGEQMSVYIEEHSPADEECSSELEDDASDENDDFSEVDESDEDE